MDPITITSPCGCKIKITLNIEINCEEDETISSLVVDDVKSNFLTINSLDNTFLKII